MQAKIEKDILIIKASGEEVIYQPEKLRASLERSGADEEDIVLILKEVQEMLYPGISTKEIYQKAFSLLKKRNRPIAARYNLKKALQQLGPSGYPFEKYIGEILKYEGFKTKVGTIVQGQCVQHEIDVIAEKENKHYMIECKHHGQAGRKCNVKIPLYVQSRFRDVEKAWKKQAGHEHKFHQGWVVTNTKLTTDAIQYGQCAGLHLMSWNHPQNGSLKERIDRSGLHPITCLTTLTGREKKVLLEQMIVLCKELCKDEKILNGIGLPPSRIQKVMKEAKALCKE